MSMQTVSDVRCAESAGNQSAPRACVSRTQRIATLTGVLVPLLGVIVAILLLWGPGITWVECALLVGMYMVTGLGITVGYHRLFAHQSFRTVKPVKFVLAVLGSMAVQGSVLKWVAIHRRHHQHSDQPDDPHSPHHFGDGLRAVLAGFWHAHMGWFFQADPPDLGRYVRDLKADRVVHVASRLFGVWVFLGLAIPAALGGVMTGSWTGALLGFVWGGLVRVFLTQHVTWSINSVCHLWGRRPFDPEDQSRNNAIFGVLGFGEGWHNNHHAFPASARHGLKWWELDAGFLVIRTLELLGLARRVRVPATAAIVRRRRQALAERDRAEMQP